MATSITVEGVEYRETCGIWWIVGKLSPSGPEVQRILTALAAAEELLEQALVTMDGYLKRADTAEQQNAKIIECSREVIGEYGLNGSIERLAETLKEIER